MGHSQKQLLRERIICSIIKVACLASQYYNLLPIIGFDLLKYKETAFDIPSKMVLGEKLTNFANCGWKGILM